MSAESSVIPVFVTARQPLRALLSSVQEPQIVLTWLARLRWFAVLGQVAAVAVAHWWLRIELPLLPVFAVVLTTLVTNAALTVWLATRHVPAALVLIVLFLDVGLLTALLYFTGGPQNPFATLYIVHVVMGVVVLGPAWAWAIVFTSIAAYAWLYKFHLPMVPEGVLDARVFSVGSWIALTLEATLIAYFIGRLARSLRQREQELLSMRERAARSEQLASLTTLAAGAAHELGSPLATIAVVAKELEHAVQKVDSGTELAEDTRLIRREVDRCRRILDRMRVDIVRDIAQQRRRLEVQELIDLVINDLPEEERPRLRIWRDPAVQAIFAPPRAVQQALGVMIRNAFDASPPGQTVTLQVHQRGENVALEVIDQGSGMPSDVARRAGEPFFTTKEPGKGMGLGLFLVRLVAEQCNGRWYLQSRENQGTRSVLELPQAQPEAHPGL
ncbi:MAG: ATP-binding protein [Phycisphaerales bacterium]|nr:ATP-binding protein [Phycisphaerales bacterium]